MPPKECPPGKILNPKTNRCVKIDGKIGKEIVAAAAAAPSKAGPSKAGPSKVNSGLSKAGPSKVNSGLSKAGPSKVNSGPSKAAPSKVNSGLSKAAPSKVNSGLSKAGPSKVNSGPSIEERMASLHKRQMEAMKNRDIALIKKLAAELEELRKMKTKQVSKSVAKHLEHCKDPVDLNLPLVPTIHGDKDMAELIKDEKQLITIEGLCYDIKSLFELIQADIPTGNVWGVNPYVRREGFIMPFGKDVKNLVLETGIKKNLLPKGTKYIDHTPDNADDIEMRGVYYIKEKTTPSAWLVKGWASDGTAFPTKKYYAITFEFPNKRRRQSPGRTVIFPFTKDAKAFIDEKLIPVYKAGALWSKSISATDGIEVINPNIHMIFEDNQPQRWYKDKIQNLEIEIMKFAPAFI